MVEEEVASTSKIVASAEKTPLVKAKLLTEFLPKGSEFYLKWEGNNFTHTHKDRAALAHAKRAVELGFEVLTVGTCGNLGVSIAYFAHLFDLRAVIFIPKKYTNSRLAEITEYGAEIVRIDGSYEDAVEASIKAARENGWYDANPGSINDEITLESHANIAFEIFEQLKLIPNVVAVPVGNGTTLAGIYRGFKDLARMDGNAAYPIIVGGTTAYGNQVLTSWMQNARKPIELQREDIVETAINEPLVAFRSLNCLEALEAIHSTRGAIYGFEDDELLFFSRLLPKLEGVRPLPASTAAILAALRYAAHSRISGVYVAIVTGGEPV